MSEDWRPTSDPNDPWVYETDSEAAKKICAELRERRKQGGALEHAVACARQAEECATNGDSSTATVLVAVAKLWLQLSDSG